MDTGPCRGGFWLKALRAKRLEFIPVVIKIRKMGQISAVSAVLIYFMLAGSRFISLLLQVTFTNWCLLALCCVRGSRGSTTVR